MTQITTCGNQIVINIETEEDCGCEYDEIPEDECEEEEPVKPMPKKKPNLEQINDSTTWKAFEAEVESIPTEEFKKMLNTNESIFKLKQPSDRK